MENKIILKKYSPLQKQVSIIYQCEFLYQGYYNNYLLFDPEIAMANLSQIS